MSFKNATDELLSHVSHDQLAQALGVSVASVRQARLSPAAKSYRTPPKDWAFVVIRLAEQQIMKSRKLIEIVRHEVGNGS